jgi:putative transposase
MNPVAAGMVRRAQDWPWSSARAHLAGADDGVVTTAPLLARIVDFAGMLAGAQDDAAIQALLASRTTGRPVGAADWIKALEAQTDRRLAPARRGPKPKAAPDDADGGLFRTVSP